MSQTSGHGPIARSRQSRRPAVRLALLVCLLVLCTAGVWVATAGATPPTISGPTSVINGTTYQPSGLACPSTSQCSAVGATAANPQSAQLVTFNPASITTPTPTALPTVSIFGESISCPSSTQCTAYGNGEMTFNPAAPGTPTPINVDNIGNDAPASQAMITCPSTTQCTIVNATSRGTTGREVTFNPTAPPAPTPTTVNGTAIDSAGAMSAVACASTTQCTAVDLTGNEVTFNPDAQGSPTEAAIDAGYQLFAIACPSVTECIAAGSTVTGSTQEVTFNPASPSTTPVTVAGMSYARGVACPSVTQCTIVGNNLEVTFNPTAPTVLTAVAIQPLGAIAQEFACASSTQCTEVTTVGTAFTFNPIATAPTPTGSHLSLKAGKTAKVVGLDANAAPGTKVKATLSGSTHKSATLKVGSNHTYSWSLGKLKTGSYTAKFAVKGHVIKTVNIKVAKK
jgi:hypothetical protein